MRTNAVCTSLTHAELCADADACGSPLNAEGHANEQLSNVVF